jgi:predicted DNA-binding ribbon-helix-helix protein
MTEDPATLAGGPPALPSEASGRRAAGERLRKRSIKIAGHSTSLSLEEVFWEALKEVAGGRGLSLNALIEEIDLGRSGNLSSAVRVYLLCHYRVASGATRGSAVRALSEETSSPS